MKNRIKPFVDSLGLSVYQFRKETGIANKTAYDLYNNPDQYPGKNVMEAICRAYDIQPGDLLVYIPTETAIANPVENSAEKSPTRKRKKGGNE